MICNLLYSDQFTNHTTITQYITKNYFRIDDFNCICDLVFFNCYIYKL